MSLIGREDRLMKELFEQYGAKHKSDCSVCRSFKHYGGVCNLDTQPTCPQANHNYSLTSNKVLALEEVIRISSGHITKTTSTEDKYKYICGFSEKSNDIFSNNEIIITAIKNTQLQALCHLLIKLHSHFSGEEKEQIKKILEG